MKTRSMVAVVLLMLTVAACSSEGDGGEGANDGARTIEVTALDDLSFDPASVEVSTGETVRFVVTNSGSADHDF